MILANPIFEFGLVFQFLFSHVLVYFSRQDFKHKFESYKEKEQFAIVVALLVTPTLQKKHVILRSSLPTPEAAPGSSMFSNFLFYTETHQLVPVLSAMARQLSGLAHVIY